MTWVSENKAAVALIAALCLVGVFALRGCSGPGKVNPKTYEFAQALMQVLQRRDDPRLPKDRRTSLTELRERIVQSNQDEEISERETALLTEIVDSALSGDEADAKAAIRAVMAAQVDH